MPFWMIVEDPEYIDDEEMTWQDAEDLDEDLLNDANTQPDTLSS